MSKKFKTPLLMLVGIFITIAITFLIPNNLMEDRSRLFLLCAYIIGSKVIMLGFASVNAKHVQNIKLPVILAFVPYVQIVMWTKKASDLIIYFTLMTMTLASPFILSSTVVLNIVGMDNLFKYQEFAPFITLGVFALWRIMHAKILGKALITMEDFLDSKIAKRHGMSQVLDYPKMISFILPILSLLGVTSLVLTSMKVDNYKKGVLASQKANPS